MSATTGLGWHPRGAVRIEECLAVEVINPNCPTHARFRLVLRDGDGNMLDLAVFMDAGMAEAFNAAIAAPRPK